MMPRARTLLPLCLVMLFTGCTGTLGLPPPGNSGDDGDGPSAEGGADPAPGDAVAAADSILPADPGPPPASECASWQTAHPEWLWCDDFEAEQDISASYPDVSTNGFGVSNEDAFAGSYSLRQHYTEGQVDAGWINFFYADALGNDYGPIQDEIYVRWYHKFEAGFEGAPPKMARVRSLYPPWDKRMSVCYWIASGSADLEIVADVAVPDSSQANDAGWLPVISTDFHYANPANIGRWTCHEMYIKNNTPGQTDGVYRFWADDQLIAERVDVDLRGTTDNNFNNVSLDTYWNGGSPKAQSRYYDNFVVSTERIGCLP